MTDKLVVKKLLQHSNYKFCITVYLAYVQAWIMRCFSVLLSCINSCCYESSAFRNIGC